MENIKLKDLKDKKFHFIGIGGISMSALALMLFRSGIYVQGSDESYNLEVKKLQKKGIKIFENHDAKNLKDVDIVVYSSAIKDDNEELKFAMSKNKIILKRAELLGLIASMYKYVIAIAGSHGKTTTTAMISEIFTQANLKPTFHIGGILNSAKSNYKIGNKKFFITEACEYKDNYLYINPDISVVLNVDSDHLDYFKNIDNVKNSFKNFAINTKTGGLIVVSADDENSAELKVFNNLATFGLKSNADIYATKIKEYKPCYYSFDVIFSKFKLGNIKLNIIGKHNIYNALASIVVALSCAIDFCDIKTALEKFSGVERRCQKITKVQGAEIYHDYAHHPIQIDEMIKVGRDLTRKSKGRVVVVFEPHTYSRTKFLIKEFVESLSKADKIFLAPVYSARESSLAGYDSLKLANEIKKQNNEIEYLENYKEIFEGVKNYIKKGDVVLVLGAGTIFELADMFKC